jgi:ligand-binding sensor domain-containing protein
MLVIVVAAGAYYLGTQQGENRATRAGEGRAEDAGTPGTSSNRAAAVDPAAHFTHFRVGQSNVKALLPEGNLMWVATSGGVIRYDVDKDNYRLFDTRSGLLANGIFHLGKIQGRLVAGTYGGGMALMNDDGDTWRIYNIPDGLGDGFVYDVLEMSNGDVWIATWSGANRVRGGELDDRSKWDLFTVANTSGGLPNDWVYALRAGKDGEVWFATEGGLARFDDGEWQNWDHEDGQGAPYEIVREQIEFATDPARFSEHHARQKEEMGLQGVDIAYNPNYIVALLVDRDGIVWCGTWGGGLARFDGTEWRNFTVADGLPGNHVFMLYEDSDGTIWIGTNNGLARPDGQGFRVFTTADGLYSNRVFSMNRAADGTYWVGSFGGVARFASLP